MSLICAVPTYADIAAVVGQDVVVINGGHSAARLRLEKVAPLFRAGSVHYRAVLAGDAEVSVREGTHLSRVGDFLVRLHLVPVVAEDGTQSYEAHAQAHLDEMELLDRLAAQELVAV